jgi:hypothetical protein
MYTKITSFDLQVRNNVRLGVENAVVFEAYFTSKGFSKADRESAMSALMQSLMQDFGTARVFNSFRSVPFDLKHTAEFKLINARDRTIGGITYHSYDYDFTGIIP